MEKRFKFKASFEAQAVISKTKGNKTKTSTWPADSAPACVQGDPAPRWFCWGCRDAALVHQLMCVLILLHNCKVVICPPDAAENYSKNPLGFGADFVIKGGGIINGGIVPPPMP